MTNVLSWFLQVCALVVATGVVLALIRATDPRLRLRTWHSVIAVSLLLPILQPWTPLPVFRPPAAAPAASSFDVGFWFALAVASGATVRAISLGRGLWRLRELRRTSEPWSVGWFAHPYASLRLSRQIVSAVTFGYRRPTVLVPRDLPLAPEAQQRAVVAHEMQHVARRDWLWVLAEEVVRIACWFHPAVWLALGEAQLAREEAVDREVVAVTGNRDAYLEALMAAAGSAPAVALGFGPQFYRRHQLKARIRSLLKENTMSRSRIIAAAAMLALVVLATVRVAGAAFPLTTEVVGVAEVLAQDPPPPPTPKMPPPPPVRVTQREMPPPPPPPLPRTAGERKVAPSAPLKVYERRAVPAPSVGVELKAVPPPPLPKVYERKAMPPPPPLKVAVAPKKLPPAVIKTPPPPPVPKKVIKLGSA